jgi:hypothetical protein
MSMQCTSSCTKIRSKLGKELVLDFLKRDPLLAVIVGKKDLPGEQRTRSRDTGNLLVSSKTLNRLELGQNASSCDLYHKITCCEVVDRVELDFVTDPANAKRKRPRHHFVGGRVHVNSLLGVIQQADCLQRELLRLGSQRTVVHSLSLRVCETAPCTWPCGSGRSMTYFKLRKHLNPTQLDMFFLLEILDRKFHRPEEAH